MTWEGIGFKIMSRMPIALLTDFGLSDAYVGILKAVIYSIAPKTAVLDLAHELPPYDKIHAGLLLYQAYRYFPKKTAFVVVVDPGVGSARRPLLVQTKDYAFIGPDNGVLTMALEGQKINRIVHLRNEKYFLKPVSSTFHGRDIFAPVAAHLAKGVAAKKFGPETSSLLRLGAFLPEIDRKWIRGRVLSVDRFGSLLTNLRRDLLAKHFPKMDFRVITREGIPALRGVRKHYAEGASRQPLLLFSSADLLEIAVNQGSAARRLKLKAGDTVKIPL